VFRPQRRVKWASYGMCGCRDTDHPKQTNSVALAEWSGTCKWFTDARFWDFHNGIAEFISPGMLRRVNWQIITDVSTNSAFETSVSTRWHEVTSQKTSIFSRFTPYIKWELIDIILLEVDSYLEENIPNLHCKYQRYYGNGRYLCRLQSNPYG